MHLNLRLKAPQQAAPKPYTFTEHGSFMEEDIRIGSKGLTVGPDEHCYDGICLDDLDICAESIGAGSSGVVKKAVQKSTGMEMAVKIMSLSMEEATRKQVLRELRTLHRCNHTNIVEFLGAFYSEGTVSILLEYMDVGSLEDLVNGHKMPEEVIGQLAAGLVSAMAYIHKELHIVHRDIKPSNVLVNSAGQVKLSDFGVSGKLANTIGQATTFAGTVTFMSPERIKGDAHSTTSDVWSLGLTVLECALGRFPYYGEGEESKGITFFDLLERIQNKPAPTLPTSYSEDFQRFLNDCLKKDPSKRPSAETLLDYAFVQKHRDQTTALTTWIQERTKEMGMLEPVMITRPNVTIGQAGKAASELLPEPVSSPCSLRDSKSHSVPSMDTKKRRTHKSKKHREKKDKDKDKDKEKSKERGSRKTRRRKDEEQKDEEQKANADSATAGEGEKSEREKLKECLKERVRVKGLERKERDRLGDEKKKKKAK